MKKNVSIAVMALALSALCVFPLFAQQQSGALGTTAPVGVIINHYSARTFATGTIPRADIDTILLAGIRSPSASNRQPWHFTVVQNLDLAQKVVPQSVTGNVIFLISAPGDAKREILDCALATQSIYLAAQAMGYGSRIYTGPVDNVNRTLKNDLGLPTGHNVVAIVRVGRVEGTVDIVSAASARKEASSMVTYK